MASLSSEGINQAIRQMQMLDLFDEETQDEMLASSGEILKKCVSDEMRSSKFHLEEMSRHIVVRKKRGRDGTPYVYVTLSGKNKNGHNAPGNEQNWAKIAFVLNYGRRKAYLVSRSGSGKYGSIAGDYFWTKAAEKASIPISRKLQEIANRKLRERGLI